MLDIRFVTNHANLVQQSVDARGLNLSVDTVLDSYQKLIEIKKDLDQQREQSNKIAKQIPSAFNVRFNIYILGSLVVGIVCKSLSSP